MVVETSWRTGGTCMVMRPITVKEAIKIADEKGLKPGKVNGTDGVQFTKGDSKRVTSIDWEEFKKLIKERKLQVYESGGWMKIMKK